MDYHKCYNDIVERARNRDEKGYTENHHIVPRCVGGGDASDNLVRLTAREHYIAHWLLTKMYRNRRLVFAWRAMAMNPSGVRYTSHTFKYAREAWAVAMAERNRGRVFSDEHRRRLRESHVGQPAWNKGKNMPLHQQFIDSQEAYYRDPLRCKVCDEPIPYRMRTRKGRKYCSRACYNVDPSVVRPVGVKANSGSFKPGNIVSDGTRSKISKSLTGLKRPRGECPHCGKEGAISLLKRWHYDKCKELKCL